MTALEAIPFAACNPAEVAVEETVLSRVDSYLERSIDRGVFPGAVVLATRGRRLFYRRAIGQTAYPDGSMREVTAELRQPFFSFSKAITTTVACTVEDQGLFGWDDPVEHHLPGWDTRGKEGALVRDLFSHSSGIPSAWPRLRGPDDWDRPVEELCGAEAEFAPRTASTYHPISGHLAGAAICTKVTGRPFAELARDLLDRIGATTTSLTPPSGADDTAVVPTPGTPGPGAAGVAWQPGGGFSGPPHDILRVVHLHLDRGAGLVPWSCLAEMHRPQFAEELDRRVPGFQGWTLGWMVGYRSEQVPGSAWLGFGSTTRPNTFTHAGHSTVLGAGDPDRDCAIAICLADGARDGDDLSQALATEARVFITNTILEACTEK